MTRSVAGAAADAVCAEGGGGCRSLRRDEILRLHIFIYSILHTILHAVPNRDRVRSAEPVSADVYVHTVLVDRNRPRAGGDAAGLPAAFKKTISKLISKPVQKSIYEHLYARDPPRQNKTGIAFARMFSENPRRRRGYAEQYTEKNKKEQVS